MKVADIDQLVLYSMYEAWTPSPVPHTRRVVVYCGKSNTWEVVAKRIRGKGYSWMYSKFEANLGYMRQRQFRSPELKFCQPKVEFLGGNRLFIALMQTA